MKFRRIIIFHRKLFFVSSSRKSINLPINTIVVIGTLKITGAGNISFPKLVAVTGNVEVLSNGAVRSVDLAALAAVTSVNIQSNALLASIDMPQLTIMHAVYVRIVLLGVVVADFAHFSRVTLLANLCDTTLLYFRFPSMRLFSGLTCLHSFPSALILV